MVAQCDANRDGKCLGYGCQEDTMHLNLCQAEGGYKLFQDTMIELRKWLYDTYAHPEIAYWLHPRYIFDQGANTLNYYPHLSAEIKTVATQQDLVLCKLFM